ncbi:hypothetical protein FKM82_026790 [Ascaphus truei]
MTPISARGDSRLAEVHHRAASGKPTLQHRSPRRVTAWILAADLRKRRVATARTECSRYQCWLNTLQHRRQEQTSGYSGTSEVEH